MSFYIHGIITFFTGMAFNTNMLNDIYYLDGSYFMY